MFASSKLKKLQSVQSQCNNTSFVKLVVNADMLFSCCQSDPLAKRNPTRCSTMRQTGQKYARRLWGRAIDAVAASQGYLHLIASFLNIVHPFSSFPVSPCFPLTPTFPPASFSDGSSFPHGGRVDGEHGDLWRGAGQRPSGERRVDVPAAPRRLAAARLLKLTRRSQTGQSRCSRS